MKHPHLSRCVKTSYTNHLFILSLLFTLALLLLSLAGCGKSGAMPENHGSGKTAAQTGNASPGSQTEQENEEDYSWFSMPEETGKLTVYSPGNAYSSLLNPAIEIFKDLYPEIEVSYTILSDEEFETRIRTEIPAGKGPDLVLLSKVTFPDIYKTMATDVFEDLNPYFGTDEEIALSDFVKPVMDVGVLNGKRYFAPMNYSVSIMMTAQSILDEIGMTAEELEPVDGFCEGAKRFREKYPDSTLFMDTGSVNPAFGDILKMYRTFGFDLIDYEAGKVDVAEERFRQYIDLVKLYYNPDYDETDQSMWDIPAYTAGGGLHLRRFPYDHFCGNTYQNYCNSRIFMANDGEEPVLFVPKNQQGGVTAEVELCLAIPKGAADKAAAWKLLKIMLSDDVQAGHDANRFGASYLWSGFPVRLSSTKPEMTSEVEGLTPDGPEFDRFVELVQSPTEAIIMPSIYNRYIHESMMPYIRGEKPWEDCWKQFMNTLELYKDE